MFTQFLYKFIEFELTKCMTPIITCVNDGDIYDVLLIF